MITAGKPPQVLKDLGEPVFRPSSSQGLQIGTRKYRISCYLQFEHLSHLKFMGIYVQFTQDRRMNAWLRESRSQASRDRQSIHSEMRWRAMEERSAALVAYNTTRKLHVGSDLRLRIVWSSSSHLRHLLKPNPYMKTLGRFICYRTAGTRALSLCSIAKKISLKISVVL